MLYCHHGDRNAKKQPAIIKIAYAINMIAQQRTTDMPTNTTPTTNATTNARYNFVFTVIRVTYFDTLNNDAPLTYARFLNMGMYGIKNVRRNVETLHAVQFTGKTIKGIRADANAYFESDTLHAVTNAIMEQHEETDHFIVSLNRVHDTDANNNTLDTEYGYMPCAYINTIPMTKRAEINDTVMNITASLIRTHADNGTQLPDVDTLANNAMIHAVGRTYKRLSYGTFDYDFMRAHVTHLITTMIELLHDETNEQDQQQMQHEQHNAETPETPDVDTNGTNATTNNVPVNPNADLISNYVDTDVIAPQTPVYTVTYPCHAETNVNVHNDADTLHANAHTYGVRILMVNVITGTRNAQYTLKYKANNDNDARQYAVQFTRSETFARIYEYITSGNTDAGYRYAVDVISFDYYDPNWVQFMGVLSSADVARVRYIVDAPLTPDANAFVSMRIVAPNVNAVHAAQCRINTLTPDVQNAWSVYQLALDNEATYNDAPRHVKALVTRRFNKLWALLSNNDAVSFNEVNAAFASLSNAYQTIHAFERYATENERVALNALFSADATPDTNDALAPITDALAPDANDETAPNTPNTPVPVEHAEMSTNETTPDANNTTPVRHNINAPTLHATPLNVLSVLTLDNGVRVDVGALERYNDADRDVGAEYKHFNDVINAVRNWYADNAQYGISTDNARTFSFVHDAVRPLLTTAQLNDNRTVKNVVRFVRQASSYLYHYEQIETLTLCHMDHMYISDALYQYTYTHNALAHDAVIKHVVCDQIIGLRLLTTPDANAHAPVMNDVQKETTFQRLGIDAETFVSDYLQYAPLYATLLHSNDEHADNAVNDLTYVLRTRVGYSDERAQRDAQRYRMMYEMCEYANKLNYRQIDHAIIANERMIDSIITSDTLTPDVHAVVLQRNDPFTDHNYAVIMQLAINNTVLYRADQRIRFVSQNEYNNGDGLNDQGLPIYAQLNAHKCVTDERYTYMIETLHALHNADTQKRARNEHERNMINAVTHEDARIVEHAAQHDDINYQGVGSWSTYALEIGIGVSVRSMNDAAITPSEYAANVLRADTFGASLSGTYATKRTVLIPMKFDAVRYSVEINGAYISNRVRTYCTDVDVRRTLQTMQTRYNVVNIVARIIVYNADALTTNVHGATPWQEIPNALRDNADVI